MSTFLDAPCTFCGYNGPGYYQEGTHAESCPWNKIGGRYYREMELSSVLRARLVELEGKLAEAGAVQAEAAEMAESALSVLDGDGELSLVGGYLGDIAALNSASPSAQALTRLVEAATNPRLREQVNQLRITFPMDPESGPNTPDDLKDFEALGDLLEAGDALLAARSGRGE